MSPDPQPLQPEQQILHYRLVEKLGEGGMGQVWKAQDLSLDRAVAIKVLPPGFASDPERLARFEREARLLASLNHPNIATLYSVHVVEGVRYLNMELVPGEDLARRLERGPIPVAEAVEIARQIASALEAAHESGVVHRDLKPANVRITPEGRVKVLDFGLAKAVESGTAAPALSQSPTFAATMAAGGLIGTAAYMSPEQARGQTVDRRADIWAFGVVLYEMLTGRRAFTGDTVSDILAGVLRAEPERAALPADTPPAIRALLERCLEKDVRRRLRDIGEALIVLEDVQAGRAPAAAASAALAPPARPRSRRLVWVATLLALALFGVLGAVLLRPGQAPPLRKFTLALQDGNDEVLDPVVSPNGRQIAYILERKLWIRDLGQLASRAVAEEVNDTFRPLWSRDGSFLVFAGHRGVERVDVAGGAISPICAVSDFSGGSGGTWDADGHLLFTTGHDHIYRIAAGGGLPVVFAARIDSVEGDLHHPFALPGGHGVICVRHMLSTGPTVLMRIERGRRKDVFTLQGGFIWDPIYDPRGYIVYSRVGEGGGLWALPFSLARGEATGEPFLIAAEGGSPSVALDGSLVYRLGTFSTESQVVSVDRSGAIRDTLTGMRRGNWSMALSPDGKLLAVDIRDSGESDIWLYDLERKSETRFAFGPGRQAMPCWSPDSRTLLYFDSGKQCTMSKSVDGSLPAEVARGGAASFMPDGRHLVYLRGAPAGGSAIWYASLDGRDSTVVLASASNKEFPTPSPHGGYLLYTSDESGSDEVYLRQFPGGERRWQVSTNGGSKAVWSRAGDRIFYWNGSEIYEVPVELEPTVHLGTPRPLFDLQAMRMRTVGRINCLPTADPNRFLMFKDAERSNRSHTDAIVVTNWPQEFAKK